MTDEKALRKIQRATLNSIRECCIYGTKVTLSLRERSWKAVPLQLREHSHRKLDERRILITTSSHEWSELEAAEPFILRVEEKSEVLFLTLTKELVDADGNTHWSFLISEIGEGNRRRSQRQPVRETFFVPVLVYFGPGLLPISALARVNDFDLEAVSFDLRLPLVVEEQTLLAAEIVFNEDALALAGARVQLKLVRNYRVERYAGGSTTLATVVASSGKSKVDRTFTKSVISLVQPLSWDFKIYFRQIGTMRTDVDRITIDGFIGSVEPHEFYSLPRFFIAEHVETHTRFNVSKHGEQLTFTRASTAMGVKSQWYSYLTHRVFKYQYRFFPDDIKDITRLMLESGNYTPKAISDLALLHGYFQFKWPLEEVLPRTKFRWLVRDGEGGIVGHTAGVRVSERLWAAIDNIGSQSYKGSWNAEFVSRWLRTFVELLSNHESSPLVKWNFSPSAGVWTKFDQIMLKKPELVYCRDRLWGVFLQNTSERLGIKNHTFSLEALPHPEDRTSGWIRKYGLEGNLLLRALYVGTESGSSFCGDFEHDYSIAFKRYFYLLKKDGRPIFLLTFSNYPDWASLNKGHDWHYLIPIGEEVKISEDEESEFLGIIKEMIFTVGCSPYRLAMVGDTFRLSQGSEWTNLLLEPVALEYAAQTLERL